MDDHQRALRPHEVCAFAACEAAAPTPTADAIVTAQPLVGPSAIPIPRVTAADWAVLRAIAEEAAADRARMAAIRAKYGIKAPQHTEDDGD